MLKRTALVESDLKFKNYDLTIIKGHDQA